MRVDAREYGRARRSGRATSVRVAPTGTAVEQYQVPLGQRHSLKDAGVVGMPSWSDRATQTETWVKVPRLSATCPRWVVTFDGGKGNIDKTMEFGDEFDGTTLDPVKWPFVSNVTLTNGTLTAERAHSLVGFPVGVSLVMKGTIPLTRCLAGLYYNIDSVESYALIDTMNGTYSTRTGVSNSSTTINIGAGYTGVRRWEIARDSTAKTTFLIDGAAVQVHTTNIFTNLARIHLQTVSGTLLSMQQVFVRKLPPNGAPEPTHGTAQPTATNRALSRPMSHAGLIRAVCA